MKLCCLLPLVLFLFPISTLGDEGSLEHKIVISASNWQDFTEEDGDGIYFDLLKTIYSDHEIVYSVSSFQRALNQFIAHQSDLMVGVYQHEAPGAIFPTWFLDTDLPIIAIFHKNKNFTEKSLKRQSVGWMAQYGLEQFFPQVSQPYKLDSRDTAFRMLLHGRLDIFLDYEHNLTPEIRPQVDFVEVHSSQKLYVAFHNTPKGRHLAEVYDKKMPQLQKSGQLSRIFGVAYQRSGLANFKADK